MIPNVRIFMLHKIGFSTNSRVLISNIIKVFFKLQSKNPKRGVFGPKSEIIFNANLCILTKFSGTNFFKISVKKYPNQTFSVPNSKILNFCKKLCVLTNSRMLASNMTIAFPNSSLKYPHNAFLIPNLIFFYFVLHKTSHFEKFEVLIQIWQSFL